MALKNAFFIAVPILLLMLTSLPAYPICGDGKLDLGEQCDDGQWNSDNKPNACRTDCRSAYCGDGVADSGEQCDRDDLRLNICADHGYYNSGQLDCKNDCTFDFSECRYCGDGIVSDGERCDDGNKIDDDGCNSDCTPCILLDQVGNIDLLETAELCSRTYQMDDYGDFGVIVIKKTGITLDCDGAIINGEGRGIGIVNFRSHDVTIKNCEVRGYEVGIKIQDAKNTNLQGNRLCGNSLSDIELVDATDNHGQNNRCNKAGGWKDDGKSACSNKFVPCNIETVTIDKQAPAAEYSRSTAYQIQKPAGPHERQVTSRSYQSVKEALKSPPGGASAGRSKQMSVTPSAPTPYSPTKGKQTASVSKAADAGTRYLFYDNAPKAVWTSKAGKVVFGSDRVPQAGMVRIMASGRLADGKQAINLLVTQPDWQKSGFINGVFPTIRITKGDHLQATIGMLKGSADSAGAIFEVLIKEDRQVTTAVKKSIGGKNPVELNLDLSGWGGKAVQVMLRVRPVKNGQQVLAVWINPHIKSGG